MRKYILAALVAGTVATPAFAQDTGPLSGFRIEAVGGYTSADVEGDSSDGLLYGVGVGYDFQSGGAVFGIEAEGTDSTIDECVNNVLVATDTLCAEFGRDLYVGGRVGAVVGANSLAYLKAGYTNARVRLDYEDGTAVTTNDFSEGANLDGVRVGGGFQFGLGARSYAKVEYRYSNYEQGFDKHQGVVGLGLRF